MFITDAHLDLAYNALRGRDVTLPAEQQQPDDEGIPTVGLPDLKRGGVELLCGTIFCMPADGNQPGYRTPEEAREQALAQHNWYQQQFDAKRLQLVRKQADLARLRMGQLIGPPATILLMEGADALRGPQDIAEWFDKGLRIVGLSWKASRYAGGTGHPGPITPEGVELVRALDKAGMIHDASHLAEESFWQLIDQTTGPVIASHSNCRTLVPGDRHLSDDMARAIYLRNGIIGINFYDQFLLTPEQSGKRRATLRDVVSHINHYCNLFGDARHVGLGTDMDGGLGREQIPIEIRTSADLPRVADTLSAAGYGDADVHRIMGDNWLTFFGKNLPL
ncbi:MAG: membrane dipeptidase [Phycisphaerales bacterium]|nr:membrane dipeptidase [Phycisphaerales bacterium]